MAEDLIKFNHYTRKEGQTINHTTDMLFVQFYHFLQNNNFIEFRLEEPKYDGTTASPSGSRFQTKILGVGKDTPKLELYYRSLDTVSMKVNVTLIGGVNKIAIIPPYSFRPHGTTIASLLDQSNYHNVPAMKWHCATMITKTNLLEILISKPNQYDSSFSLRFEFIINDVNVNPLVNPSFFETEVLKDFEKMLLNGVFSDVTIISSEKIEYKVHKAVLASRSAVLKAHFEHNTTECVNNVVESPFESEVLKAVLTFVYSGKVPRMDEIADQVLVAADYYQLSQLKSLCEEAVLKKLSVHNAIETLQLADLYSADKLKQYTLEFIKDGQAELITKTEGWAKLLSAELIKEIYEYIISDLRL